MPPRPIYRWKSFWMGVLVLVFLGWGWVRSMTKTEGLALEWTMEEAVKINQSGGSVWALGSLNDPLASKPHLLFRGSSMDLGKVRLPPAFDFTSPWDGWSLVRTAHWFLILLFLAPWTGFLIWRVRRQRLALRQVITPPSSQGDAS